MPYGTERERLSTEVFPKEGCICCAELPCPPPEFFIEQTEGLYLGFQASPAGFDPSIVNAMPPSGFRMLWLTYVNDVHHNGAVTTTPSGGPAVSHTKTNVIDYDQYIFWPEAMRTLGKLENPTFPEAIKVSSGSEDNGTRSGTWGVVGAVDPPDMEKGYSSNGTGLLTYSSGTPATDTHAGTTFASTGSTTEYSAAVSDTQFLQVATVTVNHSPGGGGTAYAGEYTIQKGFKDPLPFVYRVRLPFPTADSPMMEVLWDVEFRVEGAAEYSKVGTGSWEAVGSAALSDGQAFMWEYPTLGDFRITNVRFRCSPSQRFRDYAVETTDGPIALSTETAFD